MWWQRRTYLDSASGVAGNPSSPHKEGRCAKEELEAARKELARLIEVQADDVLFTSGATESNALAILGAMRARRALAREDAPGRNNRHVLYLPSAHASIVENIRLLAEEGVVVESLPIKDARVDTAALAKMLREETVLVAMDAVCGETGVVWNTREVAEELKKARLGSSLPRILLHVDASQAPLTEKVTREHFGADMLSLDGSKVGALRGVGALIVHRTIPLVPLYRGGGQERGLRPGTESPERMRAFAVALRAAAMSRDAFRARALLQRASLIEQLRKAIPDIFINEGRNASLPSGKQVPNILNLSLPGRDTDYLVALLDEAGFAIATRSACETDSEEGSRAVFALTADLERAKATLRISWGEGVTDRELSRFAKTLSREVGFIDMSSKR